MSGSKAMSDQLPKTLLEGGATSPAEQEAALLLRNAFTQCRDVPHPAVGVRIKARLIDRLEQPRRQRRWLPHLAFAGATALVLVGIGVGQLGLFDRETGAQHSILAGTLVPVDDSAGRLEPGQALAAATAVSCTVDACEIGILGGVRVVMQNHAVFSVRDQSLTSVYSGRVSFAVEPRQPGESFAVRAGDILVEVVGTAFSVEVAGSQKRVSVTEGIVRITRSGHTTVVRAGESWTSAAVPPEPEAPAPPEPAEMSTPSRSSPDAARPTRTPPSTAARPDETEAGSPATLLSRARGHLRQGEVEEARKICRRLTQPTAAAGELDLYQVAKLQIEKLDAPRAALDTVAEMARRFPHGSLAPERDLTAIQAHVTLGDCQRAQQAAERFRVDFPGSAEMFPEIDAAVEAAGCAR